MPHEPENGPGENKMKYETGTIRAILRRLNRQICTPPGVSREMVRFVQDEGLAEFHEWPSGHWKITDKGQYWLYENPED